MHWTEHIHLLNFLELVEALVAIEEKTIWGVVTSMYEDSKDMTLNSGPPIC